MKKLVMVLLCACLLTAGLYAEEDNLWLMFLNKLAEQVSGGAPDSPVQTLFPFKMWDWGGTEYPAGSIPYEQEMFLNVVPLAPVGNYMGSPAIFSSNYRQFLSQLNLEAGDPKIDELYRKYQDASRKYQTLENQAYTAYLNDKKRPQDEPYYEWLEKNTYWQNQLAQAAKDMKTAQDNYNNYQAEKFEDIHRAIKMYDENLIYITAPSGQSVKAAPWYTDQIPYDYTMFITGNNFGGDAVKGNEFSFEINKSTQNYDYKRYWGSASLGVKYGFFSIDMNGSFERVETSKFKSDWTISFSFQSFDAITVGSPDWYDSGVVQGRRNGPYRTGYVGYKAQAAPNDVWFFGDEGILYRKFTSMWVGYRPIVIIDAGKEVADYVKQKIDAGGKLQIGPFRFSAKGGEEETKSRFEYSGTKIIVESKGDWPYIVCMASYPTVPPPKVSERMVATKKASLEKKK